MEATCSSETSVDFQRITRCYIRKDRTLHNHRCENLKSYGLNVDEFKSGRLNEERAAAVWNLRIISEFAEREKNIKKTCMLLSTKTGLAQIYQEVLLSSWGAPPKAFSPSKG
jgi:hypothetical protein